MIIRRFLDAIRRQDWATAGIDFLIVIVGIFAALQVDQWQQEREARQRERVALAAIAAELDGNVVRLERSIAAVAASHAATEAYFEHAAGAPIEPEQMNELLSHMSRYYTSSFATSAIDALLAGGGLSLVTDQSLRQEIAGLKRKYEALRSIEDYMQDAVELKFVAALDTRISRIPIYNAIARSVDSIPEVPLPPGTATDSRTMLQDPLVQNLAADLLFARPIQLRGMESLLSDMSSLSEAIDAHRQGS